MNSRKGARPLVVCGVWLGIFFLVLQPLTQSVYGMNNVIPAVSVFSGGGNVGPVQLKQISAHIREPLPSKKEILSHRVGDTMKPALPGKICRECAGHISTRHPIDSWPPLAKKPEHLTYSGAALGTEGKEKSNKPTQNNQAQPVEKNLTLSKGHVVLFAMWFLLLGIVGGLASGKLATWRAAQRLRSDASRGAAPTSCLE